MDEQTIASTEPESTEANVKHKKEKKEKKSKASKSKANTKAKAPVAPLEAPEQAQEPEQDLEQPIPTPYDMYKELLWLRQVVFHHPQQIAELQSRPTRKRVMAHGGKVQIRDKETGTGTRRRTTRTSPC